ncbi:MAG: NADPH-dependent F420 reductase [Calditrichota bacterium]
MNISIIGDGNVGGTLGKRFMDAGHQITFGVREPETKPDNEQLRYSSVTEAIKSNSIIFLCIPWKATVDMLKEIDDASGKIFVDCTNPIGPGFQLEKGHTTSGAENLAELMPTATLVKAFNSTGFENMINPQFPDGKTMMLTCSDNPEAGEQVAQLASDIGFEGVYTGPLYHARYIEPLAMLWIDMAIKQKRGRNFAFAMLNR